MHNLVDPVDDPAVDDGHRRGRILRALATCMAEKGYPATTIADIARAGRVSKTVVYAHFRDKEECLLELYARATDQVMGTVAGAKQAARDAGLPWRDRRAGGHRGVPGRAGRSARRRLDGAGRDPGRRAPGAGTAAAGDRPVRRPAHRRRRGAGPAAPGRGAARSAGRWSLAAVGGINELILARVERGDAERLPEDADVAADVVIGLLERRD